MQCLKNGFNNQTNTHNNTEKSSNKFTKTSFGTSLKKMEKDIESNKVDKVIFIKGRCNVSDLKYLDMEEIS